MKSVQKCEKLAVLASCNMSMSLTYCGRKQASGAQRRRELPLPRCEAAEKN
jgi:hypothetical protein